MEQHNDLHARIQQGLALFDQQDWKALELFQQLEREHPEHPVPYFFASLCHFALNQLEESKRHLEEGLKRSPSNKLGQTLTALLAFREHRLSDAMTILDKQGIIEHPRVQAFVLLEVEKALLELAA